MSGEKLAGLELGDAQRSLPPQGARAHGRRVARSAEGSASCRRPLGARTDSARGSDGSEHEAILGGALGLSRFVDAPLDHAGPPRGPRIRLFCREVVLASNAGRRSGMPVLLCLQGGPGNSALRPGNAKDGWLGRALQDFRVVLLDSRGTGRSTPVTLRALAGMTAEEQASYVANFRADSIVEDCELVRRGIGARVISLLGEYAGAFVALTCLPCRYPRRKDGTNTLKGFLASARKAWRCEGERKRPRPGARARYISRHPASLEAVYVAGGLAPVTAQGPDEAPRPSHGRAQLRVRSSSRSETPLRVAPSRPRTLAPSRPRALAWRCTGISAAG